MTGKEKELVQKDQDSDSPNSSDPEYGAKTLMRKVKAHVNGINKAINRYIINDDTTEVIDEDEIKKNPGKYYIANFKGDRLDYFDDHFTRREVVKEAVNSIGMNPKNYKSIAVTNIEKKHSKDSNQYKAELDKIDSSKKLNDPNFIRTYKSPKDFPAAVKAISPTHGNPMISTSKSTEVTISYADVPKEDAKIEPKYTKQGKPKHRLMGMTSVFVHEANEYMARAKGDIEHLRYQKIIGDKSAVERKNEEIMFDKEIESKNIAGYVPLAYPNLSKAYNNDDKELFGLENLNRKTKTLGKDNKEKTLYKVNQDYQWKLAEKYVKEKNPNGELIWVDNQGRFRKFKVNEIKKNDQTSSSSSSTKNQVGNSALNQIQRIKNNEFYADDELNSLFGAFLANDVHYISPAIATVPDEIRESLKYFKENKNKKQAIIAINHDGHYMAIYISRNNDDSFSIIYLDSTLSIKNEPHHPLPDDINTVLKASFPGTNIISTKSNIQTSRFDTNKTNGNDEKVEKTLVIENSHCGAFVNYFMVELTRKNIRLHDGSDKLEFLNGDDNWQIIDIKDTAQSNDLGIRIRKFHSQFLAGDVNMNSIGILHNFYESNDSLNEKLSQIGITAELELNNAQLKEEFIRLTSNLKREKAEVFLREIEGVRYPTIEYNSFDIMIVDLYDKAINKFKLVDKNISNRDDINSKRDFLLSLRKYVLGYEKTQEFKLIYSRESLDFHSDVDEDFLLSLNLINLKNTIDKQVILDDQNKDEPKSVIKRLDVGVEKLTEALSGVTITK